jgi:hypothetical protein
MAFQDSPRIEDGLQALNSPSRIIHHYDIVLMEKYQSISYPQMADRACAIMHSARLVNNADLLIDATGVGEPVVDIFREKGLFPVPILFTGGEDAREVRAGMGEIFQGAPGKLAPLRVLKEIRVPKKQLVDAGVVLMQQGRVHVARGLKWADDFKQQLMRFKGKINDKTGRVKYEAENEAAHDDWVACYLMGAWWVLNKKDSRAEEERAIDVSGDGSRYPDYSPYDYI